MPIVKMLAIALYLRRHLNPSGLKMEISAHGLIGHLGKGLAPREMQCLLYVAAGMTSKETARELGVSPDSVDKRLLSATTKLGVTRRAALVAEAFRRGLISFAPGALPSPSPNHPSQDRETINDVFVA